MRPVVGVQFDQGGAGASRCHLAGLRGGQHGAVRAVQEQRGAVGAQPLVPVVAKYVGVGVDHVRGVRAEPPPVVVRSQSVFQQGCQGAAGGEEFFACGGGVRKAEQYGQRGGVHNWQVRRPVNVDQGAYSVRSGRGQVVGVDGTEGVPEDGQGLMIKVQVGEQEAQIVEVSVPVVLLRPVGVPVSSLVQCDHPPPVGAQVAGEVREVSSFA